MTVFARTRGVTTKSSSGVLGVSRSPGTDGLIKWRAYAFVNLQKAHVGVFFSKDEAVSAREVFIRRLKEEGLSLTALRDEMKQAKATRLHARNTSGVAGVSQSSDTKLLRRWRADVFENGSQKNLGYFLTCESAQAARAAYLQRSVEKTAPIDCSDLF